MNASNWDNLPVELLINIAERIDSLKDIIRLSSVCQSWKPVVSVLMEFIQYPCLLLAEDTGVDPSDIFVTNLEAIESEMNHNDQGVIDDQLDNNIEEDYQIIEVDRIISDIANLFKNISANRGLFSLVTHKIYNLDLPEATDKLIVATNKRLLLTLGRDLEINLLHPILRYQIQLPPMLTLPTQYNYNDDKFAPQEAYDMFITKVVMSSEASTNSCVFHQHEDVNNLPIIMVIYGECRILGFTRLGDKVWTNIETSTCCFDDLVYHNEKFYAVDCHGTIFKCDVDDSDKSKRHQGMKITSVPIQKEDWVQSYLIESVSHNHIWVALRFRKGELYNDSDILTAGNLRYYTHEFRVFKLEIHDCNFDDIPTCDWTEVKDMENEALFIGRNSSMSVESSKYIRSNSIYFTDDMFEFFNEAGGHDMGIFDMQTNTIEKLFQGLSIHPHSPPLWYL